MAEFRKLIVTTAGNNLLANTIAGSTKITFTKAVLGASNYADADIPALTALGDILQEAPILETSNEGSSIVHVAVTLNNATVAEGFTYASVGLFATDDAGLEVLFAVAGSNAPGTIPSSSFPFSVNLDLSLGISNTEAIVLAPQGEGTINDIAINTGNTWSSQNVVNRLCKAFSVRGDIVQCHPVEDYPLTVEVRSKNLIPYPYLYGTKTINGITFTDNGDGSVTANGTATADAIFVLTNSFTSQVAGETYYLSGCPIGGGDSKYSLDCYGGGVDYSRDTGSGRKVMFKDNSKTTFRIVVYSGATVNNLVFKPQLEEGTAATPYTPYTEVANVNVNVSGKNLIPYPYATGTETRYGVTFTDNGDGTITANGTATDNSIYMLRYYSIPLKAGTYNISGLPSDGSTTSFIIQIATRSGFAKNVTSINGTSFTLDEAVSDLIVQLVVFKGFNANNLVFKPQLEIGEIATEYEPYRRKAYTVDTSTTVTIPALPGVNTLYADSGKITVVGRENPHHTIDCLEKRIAALETTIINN